MEIVCSRTRAHSYRRLPLRRRRRRLHTRYEHESELCDFKKTLIKIINALLRQNRRLEV